MKRFALLIAAALVAVLFVGCEPGADNGILVSDATIDSRPTSGTAWSQLLAAANAFPGGQAVLSNQDSDHSSQAMAQALVGERLNDQARKNEVCNTVATVPNAPTDRILALARELGGYAIAADVADCSVNKAGWRAVLDKVGEGHSGGNTLLTVAERSANNWGAMSRGSATAVGALLDDDAVVIRMVAAHREYTGQTPGANMQFETGACTWHAGSPTAGINAPGATKDGHNVDGVIPEDQRRTGTYCEDPWPPNKGNYPWGALTGEALAAEVMFHVGVDDAWSSRSNALARAGQWLNSVDANPADGNDCPVTHLLVERGAFIARCDSTTVSQNTAGYSWLYST